MRFLRLFLILTLALPSVQLAACEMGKDVAASQHAHHAVANPADADSKHDCCDPAPGSDHQACPGNMHCGVCPVSVVIAPDFDLAAVSWNVHYRLDYYSGTLPPSHTSPPFRPPTA